MYVKDWPVPARARDILLHVTRVTLNAENSRDDLSQEEDAGPALHHDHSSLIITHHYHYKVSHPNVAVFAGLVSLLTPQSGKITQIMRKLIGQKKGWGHAIHFLFCRPGLISSLSYCLPLASPLSKPHSFLCKHEQFIIQSQVRVNLTNGIRVEVSNQSKAVQADLTWTEWSPL